MFVDKYAPTTISQIIGNKKEAQQILEWLTTWTPATDKKAILIAGPPGIGKTTTAHLVAKEAGYTIAEYNASDVRSVAKLKGIFALGMRRLGKEVILMDEVDGACERGGVGEIASIIRTSLNPIICIANDISGPKLKPIISVAHTIKFSRPVKSTIAAALLRVAASEGISITKDELETMCERNGNDIRAILNQLEFFEDHAAEMGTEKDAIHRADPFSATGRLIGNRRISLDAAADLVYVDYSLVPLMVQEAYLAANSSGSMDDTAAAAAFLSDGDLLNKRQWSTQDWSLLPHIVQSTVAAARSVKGPAPWQIFPQMLGKNSSRAKKQRLIGNVAKKMRCSAATMRLDYTDPMVRVFDAPLKGPTVSLAAIQDVIQRLDATGLNKEDLTDVLEEIHLEDVRAAIVTKTKTAFTNQWKKTHAPATKTKRKALIMDESDDGESDDDLENVETNIAELRLDD